MREEKMPGQVASEIGAHGTTVTIDPDRVPGKGMYFLLNAAIAPRPVAWVSTLSADGVINLAPHSYTTVFSPDPPVVGFVSVGRKDTLRNVEATGDFVYHIAGEELVETVNLTAADFPADESEVTWAGLDALPSDIVRSPRVASAPVAMECRLFDLYPVGSTGNTLVLGEVLRVHVADRVIREGRIDPAALQPIGRLAGSWYARMGELYSLERPTFRGLVDAGIEPKGR